MSVLILLLALTSLGNQATCFNLIDRNNLSFDKLLDKTVSLLIGQKSEDSSLTPKYYETFLWNDNTNENIARYSAQEIIARSGYNYENHYVASDDGYITNLIRIVNPLADRTKLKRPPVMMMHGGISDNTLWIWSSAIQHHPEKYPRVPEDGPITSWNKSLAFTLANNGYDVWLVGTRGSNIQNKGHLNIKDHLNWFDRQELAGHDKTSLNFRLNFEENFRYWNFTMDQIGQFEVPRQQEKIMEATNSKKVTLIDVSISTVINFALMSENAEFVSRLHNYVTVSPILNNRGTNLFIKLFHETFCTRIPLQIGNILSQVILSQATRDVLTLLGEPKELRYSIVKTLIRTIAGPSARFECNLDGGYRGHILQATGYKELRHYCQQVIAGHLQKYDYGLKDNLRVYGLIRPPKYDLSKIELPNWMLVSAGNDKLATTRSVRQLLRSVRRKPSKHVHIKRYNHADLLAGVEVDKFVNLPVLEFLDGLAVGPELQRDEPLVDSLAQQAARALNSSLSSGYLERFVPRVRSRAVSHVLEGHLSRRRSLAPNELQSNVTSTFDSMFAKVNQLY